MLENGVLAEGPRNADRVVREAPSEVAVGPLFPARLTNAGLHRPRGPNRLVLNSLVNPMKWDQPSEETSVGLEST